MVVVVMVMVLGGGGNIQTHTQCITMIKRKCTEYKLITSRCEYDLCS